MNYLLLDGNSIGRAANSSKTKLFSGEQETQAIYGFLRTLHKFAKTFKHHKPIVLWDGNAQWRKDIFPDYKANRKNLSSAQESDKKSYDSQKNLIYEAIKYLGVESLIDYSAEADDIAGFLSKRLTGKIVLITGDRDWQQLVNENVVWIDHRTDKMCNSKNFKEITGFDDPMQFLEAKCLSGDTSDNIPGVGGFGGKAIKEFFENFGTVEEFISCAKNGEHIILKSGKLLPSLFTALANNETPKSSKKYGTLPPMIEGYQRNLKLMKLGDDYLPKILKSKDNFFDREKFKEFCENLLFNSIIDQLDDWQSTFGEKQWL